MAIAVGVILRGGQRDVAAKPRCQLGQPTNALAKEVLHLGDREAERGKAGMQVITAQVRALLKDGVAQLARLVDVEVKLQPVARESLNKGIKTLDALFPAGGERGIVLARDHGIEDSLAPHAANTHRGIRRKELVGEGGGKQLLIIEDITVKRAVGMAEGGLKARGDLPHGGRLRIDCAELEGGVGDLADARFYLARRAADGLGLRLFLLGEGADAERLALRLMTAELDVQKVVLLQDEGEIVLGPTKEKAELLISQKMPVGTDQGNIPALFPGGLGGLISKRDPHFLGKAEDLGLTAIENAGGKRRRDHLVIAVEEALETRREIVILHRVDRKIREKRICHRTKPHFLTKGSLTPMVAKVKGNRGFSSEKSRRVGMPRESIPRTDGRRHRSSWPTQSRRPRRSA